MKPARLVSVSLLIHILIKMFVVCPILEGTGLLNSCMTPHLSSRADYQQAHGSQRFYATASSARGRYRSVARIQWCEATVLQSTTETDLRESWITIMFIHALVPSMWSTSNTQGSMDVAPTGRRACRCKVTHIPMFKLGLTGVCSSQNDRTKLHALLLQPP